MKSLASLLSVLEQKIDSKLRSNIVILKKEKSISYEELRSSGKASKKLIEMAKEKLLKETLENIKNNIEVRTEEDGIKLEVYIKTGIIILKEIPSFEEELHHFARKISEDISYVLEGKNK